MSDGNEQKESPSGRKPLTLTRTASAGTVRQSFSHGRTKQVTVEVREKRAINRPGAGGAAPAAPGPGVPPPLRAKAPAGDAAPVVHTPKPAPGAISGEETRRREDAVRRSMAEREARDQRLKAEEDQRRALDDAQRKKAAEDEAQQAEIEARRRETEEAEAPAAAPVEQTQQRTAAAGAAPVQQQQRDQSDVLSELGGRVKSARKPLPVAPVKPAKKGEPKRREGKLTLDMVEREVAGDDDRVRSLAAYRRAQQKEKERRAKMMGGAGERDVIKREVIVPENITVQELSNRMAVRVADIIKFMMRQGQMMKQSDELDADTAELIATEFGHTVKRVAESDVEEGLAGDIVDSDENLEPRPPVVTIMGHVDHGKTSLLDALRQTDVVSGEAGGITQHIGAYQVRVASGQRVTFLDTPGHAAFSAMRARGAQVTDIVVLVVAADDGVMPQTVEAIQHAKASGVPIIVAINKMDKQGANPDKVLSELTQHEVIVEQFGGDVQVVKVSALKKEGLEELVEQILLQAEVLNLRANPDRPAEAVVIESKLDKGRGTVATVLVQMGTLKRGDIVVVGAQIGRIRAITNERGQQLQNAGPSEPVEIMGLEGVPEPGNVLNVVENENRAREVADYRARAKKQRTTGIKSTGTSLESMMAKFKDSTAKELPILIKADVQGSAEAIVGSLEKLAHEEVRARVVLSGVGAINESDVQLAKGSGAPVIGFNVRASKEARDLAEREGVEIRYYNIIYDLIDDIKGVMSGMLAPLNRETFLGNAQVLEVFNISKVGKVAGCRVTDGVVRKGAKVRILRDNVVIQEMGVLSTLKRFKDEVNEVQSGQECGMSFGPFQDIKQGDVIECFNVEVVQRSL
ncbi:translation initiation factor IF-2 [Terricaulis silvestris]|uniref:Translation initiation factor IF-2 n=1 Tax=Terricaulis silvestris TaxID=2686094 RepID=A0A6I6MNI2_9CAUL|nr:translation initiation factor IF-2 [Terricaulis silvestris]QGZ97095.1 Translation initiation factor IF-2 [Terricaulis silvestris]